jgi:hypothetical protein
MFRVFILVQLSIKTMFASGLEQIGEIRLQNQNESKKITVSFTKSKASRGLHSECHRFRQAKFDFKLELILASASTSSKNEVAIDSEIIILILEI